MGSDTIIKMPLGVVAPRVLDLRVFDRALQPSVRGTCTSDYLIKLTDKYDRNLHVHTLFKNTLPYVLSYF